MLRNSNFTRQRLGLLELNDEFQKDIQELRKEWGKIEIKSISQDLQETERVVVDRIGSLLGKYGLEERYRVLLISYIEHNDFFTNPHQDFTKEQKNYRIFTQPITPEKWDGEYRIFIEVYSSTKQKDLIKAYKEVKVLQEKLSTYKAGRNKLSKNSEVDKRILELHGQGMPIWDKHEPLNGIKGIVEKEFSIDLGYGYELINKRLDRIKGRIKRTSTQTHKVSL